MTQSIGDRMKRYEAVYDHHLTPRSPVIVRVDGKAFHTLLSGANKPFDIHFMSAMMHAAQETASDMQGFKLAYVQSDECTFCLTDYDKLSTNGWFDYSVNKIVSISAATFTAYFNSFWGGSKLGVFDSRAFVIPVEDAPNVFVWRQKDWLRNSVQMLTRAHFSHKECHGKKIEDMHEMLYTKGVNWANLMPAAKNGSFITRDGLLHETLSYTQIKELIAPKEDDDEDGGDQRDDVGDAVAAELADAPGQAGRTSD